jgi:hypothetical protein
MKLTHGKLMNQDNWTDWQVLEYLQLDQYNAQVMFDNLVAAPDDNAIFHLVWTYSIKAVNGRTRPAASATGYHNLGPFRFLTKNTLIVWSKPALVSFMPLQQLKTYLFLEPMFSTLFCRGTTTKTGLLYSTQKSLQ